MSARGIQLDKEARNKYYTSPVEVLCRTQKNVKLALDSDRTIILDKNSINNQFFMR